MVSAGDANKCRPASGFFPRATSAGVLAFAVAQAVSAQTPDRTTLPIAPPPFRGRHHAGLSHLDTAAHRASDRTEGRAERPADPAGRRRLRTADLRRHDSDTDTRQPCATGSSLHALSCDGAVFADALRADDGPQSSRSRHGHHHELGERISRLHGSIPKSAAFVSEICARTATRPQRSASGI